MGVGISYMGTKRELAGDVAEVVASCRPGVILDAFAGMCSVGEAIGPTRPVWTNDAQKFASQVGHALFASLEQPLCGQATADRYHDRYAEHVERLSAIMKTALQLERACLEAVNFDDFIAARAALTSALENSRLSTKPRDGNLFTLLYPDTFIGVKQAIDVDAIVWAIGWRGGEVNRSDHLRWAIIALGRAILRLSNSTGHFAQYLSPKIHNFRTFQRQRRRSIWREWLGSNDEMRPVGTRAWRAGNKAFNLDALSLFTQFASSSAAPSVVYADPPYTNDQYSRFYHLFETLIMYDYPSITGAGRYRDDRFSTSFSLKSQAGRSIVKLIRNVHALGADFVLSYPTNGLAYSSGFALEDQLRSVYGNVEVLSLPPKCLTRPRGFA